MTDDADPAATARAIIEANSYMTLGTADASGRPWVSPVWYAFAGHRALFWVSDPQARHSRNLVARPELSIVIFDSHSPIGTGRGVYVAGHAEQLTGGPERERGIAVFSRRSVEQGANAWSLADVQPPARLRLYRAVAAEVFVGTRGDERIPVSL